MQETIDPALEFVSQARSRFESISARQLHLLSFVPDDKLTWTPSPTAKSALRIVAHSAITSRYFAGIISGTLAEMPTIAEFMSSLHEDYAEYTSRESVVALLNDTTAELSSAIGAVNAETIESMPVAPFGPAPMKFLLPLCYDHMADHVGQLEYLQTIWGDLDNHMG